MANIITISDFSDPRLDLFARLTEGQLRRRQESEQGIFIAESPKVIERALNGSYTPVALLMEQKHIEGDGAPIIARCPEVPVYTADRQVLEALTGFALTRGVLCAMERRALPTVEELLQNARRVAVLEGIVDPTNVGAIFRSAAALGIDAVLLTPTSCDPLNRRSIRVSMGSVFLVPWTWMEGDRPLTDQLHDFGLRSAAMALTDNSVSIDDPQLCAEPRLAIIMGTEGDGLPRQVISSADYTVRIPMSHCVDSLNVAAAAAVAFWQLRSQAKA